MEEIWKDINGYEGLYQVSNYGRVRSLGNGKTKKEKLLKPEIARGYLQVRLYIDGKAKTYKVHRLVAEAFIPNPLGLPEVNHIDEDKTNNIVTDTVTNLEWCDRKYNLNYGTRGERCSKAMTNHPSVSRCVYQYTKSGAFVRFYPSAKEAERQTGILACNIVHCCRGDYGCNSAGNYRWSYIPPISTTVRSLF